jgi:hypothetical protein
MSQAVGGRIAFTPVLKLATVLSCHYLEESIPA